MKTHESTKSQRGFIGLLNRKLNLNISTKISLFFGVIFALLGAAIIVVMLVVMNQNVYAAERAGLRRYMEQAQACETQTERDTLAALLITHNVSLSVNTVKSDVNPGESLTRNGKITTYTAVVSGAEGVVEYILVSDASEELAALLIPKITLITAVCVSLIVVMLLGTLAAKGVTLPIRRMTETTKMITKDALDTRLDTVQTQDEFKDLSLVINNMLDNLQVTIESQERFVSDASHEMRTPIAVIKGYANMLNRWGTQDEAVLNESIEAISKEADNMQQLIDNLLFLSRTDRAVLSITYAPFVLSELVDELVKEGELVDAQHLYRRGRMEVVDIVASREMVKQLVRIILENAKKYTPMGGMITLECFIENGFAVVCVQDQGIGIAPKDLAHVFDRFFRADKARKREGGSGLGMSIAKKIADVHHGEIILESKLNEGTRVMIYLPLTQESAV